VAHLGLRHHIRLRLPSDRSMISRRTGTFLSKPFHKAPRRVSSARLLGDSRGKPDGLPDCPRWKGFRFANLRGFLPRRSLSSAHNTARSYSHARSNTPCYMVEGKVERHSESR